MATHPSTRLAMTLHNEPLPLSAPFRISGYVFEAMPATVVTLSDDSVEGRGEAAGVYYMDDFPKDMMVTLESHREAIESGLTRDALRELLPPGGARNAVDCALWEVESRRAGVPVWKLAGLSATSRPILKTTERMRPAYDAPPPATAAARHTCLLFLGDTTETGYAKTAFGLRDWAPERCLGEFACEGATVTTGLPSMTPAQARAQGASTLVIGVANAGGVIPGSWIPALVEALEAGLDLVSGMHVRLDQLPALSEAAARHGRQLIDVRRAPPEIPVATGRPRSGKRLLTVGTDCALGKKYTALALARALVARGVDADFRATGQSGILISGGGIAMDAVVADFAAGAAELLSPAAADTHWDIVEGQGSLCHPAYAGVALALLHGSQPDVVVVCHHPGRSHVLGHPEFAMPTIEEVVDLTLRLGRRTNPALRCAGVSLNTSHLDANAAERLLASEAERLGLAVADPMLGGAAFDRLVDDCLRP